jgi:hypothetical protein
MAHFSQEAIWLPTFKHDPEKCAAVFPRDKRRGVCAEIMLHQRAKSAMMIQPNLIAL